MKAKFAPPLALFSGFALSFLGLGILWVGTPWHWQVWMGLPFALLAFVLCRWSEVAGVAAVAMLIGAAPIGSLLAMFRDSDNSHFKSYVVILSWAIGLLLGYALARATRKAHN